MCGREVGLRQTSSRAAFDQLANLPVRPRDRCHDMVVTERGVSRWLNSLIRDRAG